MKPSIFIKPQMLQVPSYKTQLQRRCTTFQRNSKAFRKRQSLSVGSGGSSKIINTHLSTHYSQSKETEIYQCSFTAQKKSQTPLKKPEERTMNVIAKRLSKPSKTKKRSHVTDSTQPCFTNLISQKHNTTSSYSLTHNQEEYEPNSTSKTFRNRQEIITQTDSAENSKKRSLPKRVNLKDEHILEWIDQVLAQNSLEDLDHSVRLAAVKKARIDPASLDSQKISPETITRIYRCLYVYSQGFSQFLKSTCNHSKKVHLDLWQVYATLIEHCSGGSLQTITTALTAQNKRTIDSLRDQLSKKQEIIENNDTLNINKNETVYKQLKRVTFQNQLLNTQKTYMVNSLQDSEKAFGDEISLRLLFQQKINSIHYAYREISDKHTLLYKDYKKKVEENQQLVKQNCKLCEENGVLKQQKWGVIELQKQMKTEVKALKHQLKTLQEESFRVSSLQTDEKTQKSSLLAELIQSRHKITRLQKEHQNTESTLKMLRQSYHSLRQDYEKTLQATQRQSTALQQQTKINNSYFQQRKNLSQQQISFQNEKAFFLMKTKQKDEKILKLNGKIKELQNVITCIQEEKEFIKENMEQIGIELQSAGKCVESYKEICRNQEIAIGEYKMEVQGAEHERLKLDQLIPNLKREIGSMRDNIMEKQVQIEQLKLELQKTQGQSNKILTFNEEMILKTTNQVKELKGTVKRLQKQLIQNQIQLERYREQYNKSVIELNNEKFQRKTLDVSYKHSLSVLESNAFVKKELKTKIGELQERLQEEKLEMKVFHMKYETKIAKIQEQNQKIKSQIKIFEEQAVNKRQYVHPIILQDLRSLLLQKQQKIHEISQTLKYFTEQFSNSQLRYKTTLQTKETSISHLNAKVKELKALNELDIEYQKKKQISLLSKIQDLQQQIMQIKSKQHLPVVQFKQKQKRYLDVIKQKNQKMQFLMKETEVVHGQYHQLAKKIEEKQSLIIEQQSRIALMQEQYYSLQGEKNNAMESIQEMARQRFTLVQQIRSQEESLNSQQLRSTLKRTNNRLESAQRWSPEEDIRISLLSRHSKHSKQAGDHRDLNQAEKGGRNSRQKNKAFEWRGDLSSKMKNAAIYYSK